jgi:anti-sigma B factor antagonist
MRSPTPLVIEERVESSGVRVALTGELDLATKCELRRRLFRTRTPGDDVVLDLSRLEFIDAAGAGMLIRAFADSRRHDWNLRLDPDMPPQVARVLDLVGLERPTA